MRNNNWKHFSIKCINFVYTTKHTTTKNLHKRLKPSLVAFYDIRSGNGMSLFSKKWTSKKVNEQGKK